MTEKEALEIFKNLILLPSNWLITDKYKGTLDFIGSLEGNEAIQTILNLIEKLLKENEQLRTEVNSLKKELILECEEKDKIIEQMTYYIMNLNIDEDICKKVNCDTNSGELDCKDCIKQYFENKAKEIK